MKYYGKAEESAKQIVAAFKNPEQLPAALAPIFIRRNDDTPCRSWSWNNQLLTALCGHSDARGYRQWQAIGRQVKKGEKSFAILSPCISNRKDKNGEKKSYLSGFKATAVFGLSQTEGDELPPVDENAENWLQSLPLREVAEAWDLTIESYNGRINAAQGWYRSGSAIAVGVENLSTWCHELIHAADDRNGSLSPWEKKWSKETVAELGGAILLTILGHTSEADLGGCWKYIECWCQHDGIDAITACNRMLKRTCEAVALVLDTAEQLQTATA